MKKMIKKFFFVLSALAIATSITTTNKFIMHSPSYTTSGSAIKSSTIIHR